jgi:HSP20 family protein
VAFTGSEILHHHREPRAAFGRYASGQNPLYECQRMRSVRGESGDISLSLYSESKPEIIMNTQLTRWNPQKDIEQMQNRLASLLNWDPFRTNGGKEETLTVAEWTPRVDIAEDEKEILVKAELPEMKKEDVKVTVDQGVLTISGERKLEKEEKTKKYHRIESEYGSFLRSFTLPEAVLADKVTAEFKEGMLKVHLPKDTKAAGKSVEIKVA